MCAYRFVLTNILASQLGPPKSKFLALPLHLSSKITHINQFKDVLICKVDTKFSHKLVQKFMSILA